MTSPALVSGCTITPRRSSWPVPSISAAGVGKLALWLPGMAINPPEPFGWSTREKLGAEDHCQHIAWLQLRVARVRRRPLRKRSNLQLVADSTIIACCTIQPMAQPRITYYVDVCMYAWTHACMHACMDVCYHVMYMRMCMCMFMCSVCVCMYMSICVYMCMCMRMCICSCMYRCLYTYSERARGREGERERVGQTGHTDQIICGGAPPAPPRMMTNGSNAYLAARRLLNILPCEYV
jgi:hypothetical protein